jgi:hypothetical protein
MDISTKYLIMYSFCISHIFFVSSIYMKKIQKILLVCGILSTILYISTDILLGLSWQGYSFNSQAISELSAIGAPTRPLWVAMTFLFNPLLIAFGIGVSGVAGGKRALRTSGILLTVWGITGFLWLFFPMHMRGAIGSVTDTMHLVMAGVTVSLLVAFIGFGSGAQGKWFRYYSILTIVVMLIFGASVGQQAPQVAAQLPTPWMGVKERVSVYLPMIWVLILAIILIRREKKLDLSQ